MEAVKIAYIIGQGDGTLDVDGLVWEDLRGNVILFISEQLRPQRPQGARKIYFFFNLILDILCSESGGTFPQNS